MRVNEFERLPAFAPQSVVHSDAGPNRASRRVPQRVRLDANASPTECLLKVKGIAVVHAIEGAEVQKIAVPSVFQDGRDQSVLASVRKIIHVLLSQGEQPFVVNLQNQLTLIRHFTRAGRVWRRGKFRAWRYHEAIVSPLKQLAELFSPRSKAVAAPELKIQRFRSKADFDLFCVEQAKDLHEQFITDCALFKEQKPFTVDAFCYVCNRPTSFPVDFRLSQEVYGKVVPAWRNLVFCPRCNLSNHIRAAVQLVETEGKLQQGQSLYLTEAISPLFRAMRKRHHPTEGSEFLGSRVKLGKKDSRGVRNEDLTKLTYADNSFAAVMSFEVLEHVPDFKAALRELARVLSPGGHLVMTAPFNPAIQEHLVRARIKPDGSIEHLMEPEYHIDPLDPQGCLCYYHFGWQLLGDFKEAGFNDAYVVRYYSRELGYLGIDPLMFIATIAD